MKHFILLVCLLFSAAVGTTHGQSLDKRFLTHISEAGQLFHIRQQPMSPVRSCPTRKSLLYDMTHMLGSDSVTFTASFWTAQLLHVPSVRIERNDGVSTLHDLQTLYVEPDKQLFKHRIRFVISMDEAKQLFAAPGTFILNFGGGYVYFVSHKRWGKDSEAVSQIFQLIELNTK